MHMQKRDGSIDAAKGLGILFVIVGHGMSPVMAAIEALMVLCDKISCSTMDFIKKLGKMSMEIYMPHAPILVVGRSILIPLLSHKPGIYIVLFSSITLGISIFGTLIIRKTKHIRQILFGDKEENDEKDTCLGNTGNRFWRSKNDVDRYGYVGG